MDKKMKKRMLRRRRPRLGGPQRRSTTRRAPSGGHRRAAPGKMSKHQQQQKLKRGGARQRQDEIRRLDLVLTTKNRKTVENRMAKGNKDNGGALQWEAAATLAAEHPDWSAQDAVVHSSSGGDGDSSNGRIGKIAQERRQRRAAHSETTATQLGPAEGCSRYSCGRNCSSSGAPVLPTTVTQVHRHTTRRRAALAEEGASSQFASVATTLKKRNAPIRPLEGRASPYHPLLAAHKTCTTTFITIDAKRRCRPNNKGTTNNLLPNKAAIEEQLANTIHYQPRLQKQSNQTEIHQPKEGNAPSANGIGFGGDAKSGSPDSGDYLLRIKSLKHRVVSSLSSHRRIHHRHQNKEFAAALDTSKQLRPPVQRLKSMPPPSSLKSHTNNRPPVARRGCSGGGSVSLANVLSGTTTRHNHRANLVRPIRGGGGDAVCNSMAPITASDRQQSSQYLTRQRLTQQADMAQVAYGAGLVVQPSQVDTMRNQEAASQSRLISLQQQQQLRQPRQSQYNEMDQIRALSRPYQWHWSETEKSHECIVNKDRLSLCFHPHCSESAAACRASEPLRRNGNYYYWEIYVHDKIYGTSVMFGLCTSRQRMHANDYCNLIGLDDCGWSLSHKGLAWHNGLGVQYTSVFPANQPITIGLLYNTMRGELSYFMNGKNLGVAFKGLNDIQQELYPVVASTAKCTQMTLLGSYCGYVSLLERSCFTLLKSVGVKDRLEFIEYLRKQNLPKHLLHYVAQAANVNCQSATVSGLDELATSGHPHEQTQQQHTAGNGTKYHPHVMPPRTGGGGGSSSSSRRIQKQE